MSSCNSTPAGEASGPYTDACVGIRFSSLVCEFCVLETFGVCICSGVISALLAFTITVSVLFGVPGFDSSSTASVKADRGKSRSRSPSESSSAVGLLLLRQRELLLQFRKVY